MKQYQTGDIVIVDLGLPPVAIKGHEQAKTRPCVVVKFFPSLKLMTVVPCTSQEPKYSLYTVVPLTAGAGGLAVESYALCHQIRSVSIDRIIDKKGALSLNDWLRIRTVLIDAIGLG
jgi:mRNA-degrading endonuclease toxin of MazEF toxin-antitoxin module